VDHSDVIFRTGPTGRRAGLAAGPDVWEIARAVKSARGAEPSLSERELLALVTENTGVSAHLIRIASEYWAAHPDEIDAQIAIADAAEQIYHREQRS
jgi:hypothetical protein